MNITPKEVCDAGFAVSFAQARRLIAQDRVVRVCSKCGACRCDVCREKHVTCRVCGEKHMNIHRRGVNF